jgi:hypothetical protein
MSKLPKKNTCVSRQNSELSSVRLADESGALNPDFNRGGKENFPCLKKRKRGREQGARGIVQMGSNPHLNENHLAEVGESDPCSAPLHGRRQGSFPPAPFPPAPCLLLKPLALGQRYSGSWILTSDSFLRKAFLSLSIVVTGLVASAPSYAISLPIPDFIGSILDDVKSEYTRLEKEVRQKVDDSWANIATDAREAIQAALGDMGTPDPDKSTEDLRARLRNSRSLPETKQLTQRLERDLTRASVSSTLGLEGQKNTSEKITATTQIAQETQNLAQQAQSMDASQNVLKVIAAQNAQMVSAITRFHSDSLASRQDTAQSNMMLTQMADSLANSNSREELMITGQAALTQELVAMSLLDPARKP